MSNLGDLNFDAQAVEPNVGFDVIPAGEYDAVIVSSKVEPTKSGNGRLVVLELQVLSGEHQNRKLFDRLNLWNPSEKAVQIARGTLSAICRAINVLTPKDTSELHNKPLRVKVAVSEDPQYGKRNEVKGYKARNAGPVAPNQPAVSATTAGETKTPW